METYVGHIKTPQDALIVFEACRLGQLSRIGRRLSIKEGIQIKSGSVFAWDESEAGMRRWTDGRTWSPSRVSGSFLTYRELATKRRPRRNSKAVMPIYTYKTGGLIKQSFSICTASNQKLHLISYYSRADVAADRLRIPSTDCSLREITVPKGMYPDLNPLDTGGGHSTAVRSITRHPSSVPSLTLSPVSSDEETSTEPTSPVFYYSPRPPPTLFGSLLSAAMLHNSAISTITTATTGAAAGVAAFAPTQGISRSPEDKRQIGALERLLKL